MAFEDDKFSLWLERNVFALILLSWFGFTGMWWVIGDIRSQFQKTEPKSFIDVVEIQWKVITLQNLNKDETEGENDVLPTTTD